MYSDQIQDVAHARQVLYHWACLPHVFWFKVLEMCRALHFSLPEATHSISVVSSSLTSSHYYSFAFAHLCGSKVVSIYK
jgi:hypothetical protein